MPRSQVDEQVVKMSFDNSNFDGNINDSIKALNSLDNSLNLLNKNNFSSLTVNVDNLAKTFSVKGQIMLGILTSIGNKIYDLGNKAFRKLTKGIRDGIGEYNTIIESTEAIYQNVKQNGNSLQDVNNALDELNDYADKTIYNFGQMTRMIGMFSSAGVGLKSSVSTIKGLANSAALVGANMQKAQMAWNAVSRAMSSGRFTNVTWRSLELSGIAGKQFNKVITEVARTMKIKGKQTGKDIDGMIKKWGSLRESLREGWLTKDVFTEAMDIMSGAMTDAQLKQKGYTEQQIKELRAIAEAAEEAATRVKTFKQLMETVGEAIGSGWAQSFRILIGDLEEAKKLYTRISNVISDFIDNNANIRNELFKQIVNGKDRGVDGKWKSGRDNFRQIIENMLAIVKTFLKSVKTGFYNIFPVDRMSAAARKVLAFFENFTRAFVINAGKVNKAGETVWDTSSIDGVTKAVENLIRFFRGLASAVDIAWMAISQPIKAIIERIPFFDNFFKNTNSGLVGIIEKLGKFGDKITVVRDVVKDYNLFGFLIGKLIDNIDELGEKYPILGAILFVFRGIKKAITNLKDAFKALNIKPLSAAFGLFKMVVTSLWNVLNSIFGVIRDAKNSMDWSWLEKPKQIIINTLKVLSDYGRGLINFEQATSKIGGVLGTLFSSLNSIFNKTNITSKVKTASYEIEKQSANLSVTVDKAGKKVQTVWDKIKGFFTPVVDLFKKISTSGEFTFGNITKKVALLGGGIAAASLSVTHLVKTFGKIKIINNINDLLASGVDVLKAYEKQAQSKAILNVAVAIGILAVSMAALAFIPYDRLEDGLTIFVAFMSILSMTLPPIINAIAKFNESLGKTKKVLTQFDVLNNLTNQVGKIGMKLAKGFNKQSLGKMFKDIAISILILVGALSALVLLFKYDKDNTITAIKYLANIIVVLSIAVGSLILVMNLFSKTASNFAGAFSQFAKLAGVSGIIISISLAILVLVGAMSVISKIPSDRLETSFVTIGSLIILIGALGALITGIASSVGDTGKIKKIKVSITGAVLAIIAISASFALLVKYINQDQSGAWWKAAITIGALMAIFMGMISSLIKVSTGISDAKVFKKLGNLAAVMTGSVLAIAAGLYLLSYAKPIPDSIVETIRILSISTMAILAFMAAVTAATKSDFSTKFVKVIEGISFAISAIVASFGVLTAGVAALIVAINNVDISKSDSDKATSSIVNKLTFIANTISKALPELKKLFYSIGQSIGSVFTSFTSGFVNTVMEAGESYNEIAEKFVNLVIDILGKVVGILKTRKDDIAKIIGDLVEFLGTEIAAAINAFFSKNGQPVVSSDQVLNWIGIGGLAVGGGKLTLNIIKDLNAIYTATDNLKKVFKGFSISSVFTKIITKFSEIKIGINQFIMGIREAFAHFKSWAYFVKLGSKIVNILNIIWNVLASIVGVAGIIIGLISGIVGVLQEFGVVSEHLDTNFAKYNSKWDAFKENLTNLGFIFQSFIYGFKQFGMGVVTFFESIGRIVIGVGSIIMTVVIGIINILVYFVEKIVGIFNKDAAKSISDFRVNVLGTLGESFLEVNEQQLNKLKDSWGRVFDYSKDEAYKTSKEISENWNKGGEDGLYAGAKTLADIATKNAEGVIKAEKKTYQEASPSKVSYGIYWNYILGAKNALSAGGKELVKVMEGNNKKLIKETLSGVNNLEDAYKKIGAKTDTRKGLNKYDDLHYTAWNNDGSREYRTVSLNKELTEAILEQEDALRNMSKAEAQEYINQQAYTLGIENREKAVADLTNFLYDQHENRSTLFHDSMEKLRQETELDWGVVLSSEQEAAKKAVEDQENTNQLLVNAADKLKNQLVGKKAEQAKEILKQELIQQGMSEEQAEEEAAKYIALVGSKQKNKKKIELQGLKDAKSTMQAEIDLFREAQEEQTAILEEELAKREKATAIASKAMADYSDPAKRYGQGKDPNAGMTVTELAQKLKAKVEANNKVKLAGAKLDQIIAEAEKRMEKNGLLNAKQFKEDYDKYLKEINKNRTGKKTVKDVLSSAWNKITSTLPKTPDLTTWKMPTTGNKNPLKDDKNKAIDASKDLKKDLEKNRADLTPTFDLDKLASDANKANGIVMSSLMAAQNAAIGDYINNDSELNPFMKDRWQNVYNFTQNNYSPKALSRIDIYRQTQRQLSMSRGF